MSVWNNIGKTEMVCHDNINTVVVTPPFVVPGRQTETTLCGVFKFLKHIVTLMGDG